eukprot:678645-Rhodomonas_salina.2
MYARPARAQHQKASVSDTRHQILTLASRAKTRVFTCDRNRLRTWSREPSGSVRQATAFHSFEAALRNRGQEHPNRQPISTRKARFVSWNS